MIDPTLTAQYVQAYHIIKGSNLPVKRIVIHGTVSPTRVGNALSVARYFQSPRSGGSAQYVLDPATVIQCAGEAQICWHAPPNPNSLGVEFSDLVDWIVNGVPASHYHPELPNEAAWNNRWSLPAWDAMLRLGAAVTRALADKHSVPLVQLSSADLLAGHEGICGHDAVSGAWHQTDHHDPGATFPWATFMRYVIGGSVVPPPAHQKEDKMYFIAYNAHGPDIWRGDGVVRTHFTSMKTIENYKYAINKAGGTVVDLGKVDDLDAIGAAVGEPPAKV